MRNPSRINRTFNVFLTLLTDLLGLTVEPDRGLQRDDSSGSSNYGFPMLFTPLVFCTCNSDFFIVVRVQNISLVNMFNK